MIVFLRDETIPGPKLLDIEITNTFPLVALTQETHLICPGQDLEILKGYDHIAIPPDFRLHISGPTNHIFFDAACIWNMLEGDSKEPLHYFTIIGLPSNHAKPVIDIGQTRKWYQCIIISPFKDKEFNSSTRLFVDFFLHHTPLEPEIIYKAPLVMQGMRLANDRSGSLLGPYSFASFQRKKTDKDIALTMRFGFVDIENKGDEIMCIYTPLDIFQKRPR